MITVINSKKIFQADPDTGENIGVHIYELVGASTDIAGTKEGFLEWVKQNDIPVNLPGAFGNGSTFYAIDTKKKFIFFNGQFYELPTQGGGGSDPVDSIYDMVVKITIDETFEETGNLVANYTYDEIRDAIRSGKNVCGVLNIEGTAIVFTDLANMHEGESYVIRFRYMGAGISNGTDPLINDITCYMHSDSSIPYAEFQMNTINLATKEYVDSHGPDVIVNGSKETNGITIRWRMNGRVLQLGFDALSNLTSKSFTVSSALSAMWNNITPLSNLTEQRSYTVPVLDNDGTLGYFSVRADLSGRKLYVTASSLTLTSCTMTIVV